MEIPYLSTTLIKNYPICGMRAIEGHNKRLEEGDGEWGANPTRFGTIVHNVAEEMHQLDIKGETADPMEVFDKHWQASNLFDLEYFTFGRGEIEEFIDRTLFNRAGVTIETELGFILDMVSGKAWRTAKMTRAQVEKKCAEIRKAGGVPVISKIDRIDKIELGSGIGIVYEVYDYKTNRQPFTRDEVDNSEQLAIYHLAVLALFPDASKIICIFDMLRHGRFRTIFDDERLSSIRSFIVNLWEQIKRADVATPELNKYSSWCDIRESCPVYAEALLGDLTHPYAPAEGATAIDLWNDYSRLSTLAKLAEERANQFKEVIVLQITDGQEPIHISETEELVLQPNPRYEYSAMDIFSILKKRSALTILQSCVTISRPNLERAIKGRVDLQNEILPTLQKSFAKPTLKKRKIKKGGEDGEDTV